MKQRLCILLAGLLCLGLNIGNRKTEKPAAADGKAVTAYLDVSASAGNDGNFIYTEGNISDGSICSLSMRQKTAAASRAFRQRR